MGGGRGPRLAQSEEYKTLDLQVVGLTSTLGVEIMKKKNTKKTTKKNDWTNHLNFYSS